MFAALAAPAGAAATNGLIAFQRTTSPTEIRTVDPVATDAASAPPALPQPKVVPGIGAHAANAAWSTDATMLAYSTNFGGGPPGIWVINADGTNPRLLVRDPVGAIDPTWSPDDKRIAFTSVRNGSPDIYVINVDGTGERRLTFEPTAEQQPAWSPDGSATRIAYESDRAGNLDIWLMALDGSPPTRVTSDPADESDAAWSPDATRVAFSSGAPGAAVREIFSVNPSGSDRRQLTTLLARSTFPAWSPDGTQIAFSSNDALAVMPSAGGTPRQLATAATDPAWARLPTPVVKATGDVTVNTPGASGAGDAAVGQTLPTGTEVDATNGAIVIGFSKPTAPARAPDSTVRVENAEFTVAKRTPEVLTVVLEPVDCGSGSVRAARAKRRRSKLISRSPRNGAKTNARNKDIHTSAYGTTYSVTESCQGTTVNVTEGRVDVEVLRARRVTLRNVASGSVQAKAVRGPSRTVKVVAGRRLFVPS